MYSSYSVYYIAWISTVLTKVYWFTIIFSFTSRQQILIHRIAATEYYDVTNINVYIMKPKHSRLTAKYCIAQGEAKWY